MSKNAVVVGAQWGDEGKGKVVDSLAEHFDIVARYQGGANAGHTVVVGGKKFILQLLPSGILRPGKTAVIGNGVVVDPLSLLKELDAIEKAGIEVGDRLRISDRCHLILPYHRTHEAAAEQARGVGKIGTTAKGIGPTYEDKAGRRGLRACDLRDPEVFRRKCHEVAADKNRLATALFPNVQPLGDEMIEQYLAAASRMVPYLVNVSAFLNAEMQNGRRILFEGAQGTLLDLDHGTYPFVTSSSAAAGGASTGTGVGPTRLGAVVGVSKAYATRVGEGPFPTEIEGPDQARVRELGEEYGTTTGRERRCGWLDLVALRYAVRVNGIDQLALTKLDVLSEFAELPVCTRYRLRDGSETEDFPAHQSDCHHCEPVYETLPGWEQPLDSLTDVSELPAAARGYVELIEQRLGVEVCLIGTGRERERVLQRVA